MVIVVVAVTSVRTGSGRRGRSLYGAPGTRSTINRGREGRKKGFLANEGEKDVVAGRKSFARPRAYQQSATRARHALIENLLPPSSFPHFLSKIQSGKITLVV